MPHGAYFGVASLVAASLVVPERRGRAVAAVMLGLSVANVVGVPLATFLGQQVGWRTTYLLGGVLALVTVVGVLAVVPSLPGDPEASGRKEAREFFGSLQVWLTMAVGAVGFGGMFAVYSYIAKTVTEVGGLERGTVPFFVLALGLGMVAGTWLAGEPGRVVGLPQPDPVGRHRHRADARLLARGAARLAAAARRLPGDRHRLGARGQPPACA
ncbi:MFS transporter [Nocardioides convexus]|uniref:MFS transporter n=1 Tax=Nocardioides convexus TaxID=2712224 RepID=UPI0024187FEF|nr:MFS transporter [Nocardioides convexus]